MRCREAGFPDSLLRGGIRTIAGLVRGCVRVVRTLHIASGMGDKYRSDRESLYLVPQLRSAGEG